MECLSALEKNISVYKIFKTKIISRLQFNAKYIILLIYFSIIFITNITLILLG